MRLIYLYVYESERFGKIEMNFTDEYEVSLNETKTEILIRKNDNYKNLAGKIYSEYVKSITVLVGMNGVGKSTLLNFMGLHDSEVKYYYENVTYFMLYEWKGRFYIESKEGKEKIECIIEQRNECPERYWQAVDYYPEMRKLCWISDKSLDFCFPNIRDEYGKLEYFFYRDRSAELTGWTYTYGIRRDEESEKYGPSSIVARTNIKNAIHDIYYFMNQKSEMIQKISKRKAPVKGKLVLNTNSKNRIKWHTYADEEAKKTFVIQMLFNLCLQEHSKYSEKELEELRKEFVGGDINSLKESGEYEYLKNKLIDTYVHSYDYKKDKICELVQLLEEVDNEYYGFDPDIYLQRGMRLSSDRLEFYTEEEYDAKLYEVLKCITEFSDDLISYRLFSYEYDSLSAGEAKCVDIFAGVYQSVNKRQDDLKNKSLIILLDEPDKCMHPELARDFIRILNEFSEELGKQSGCIFQYIITTHSPFFVLDVPEMYVYRMKQVEEKVTIERRKGGIMSNIADLIKDTFFLGSPFGVLSEQYFKMLQERINELDGEDLENKVQELKEDIGIINELVLKNFLYEKLESKLEKACSKEDLLSYYEKKIEELKKND